MSGAEIKKKYGNDKNDIGKSPRQELRRMPDAPGKSRVMTKNGVILLRAWARQGNPGDKKLKKHNYKQFDTSIPDMSG